MKAVLVAFYSVPDVLLLQSIGGDLWIGRCHGEPSWVVLWENPKCSDGTPQMLDNRGL